MERLKAMGKLVAYWKMVVIEMVRKKRKTWGYLEICDTYE